MNTVSRHIARPIPARIVALCLLVSGCGNASGWTDLHVQRLPQSRDFLIQGQRDANGLCFYNLNWLPRGTLEIDRARNDTNCQLVANVGALAALPRNIARRPSRIGTSGSSACAVGTRSARSHPARCAKRP